MAFKTVAARFVWRFFVEQDSPPKRNHHKLDKIIAQISIFGNQERFGKMFVNIKINYVVFVIFLTFGLLGCAPNVYIDPPTRLHDVLENDIQLIWSREEVYAFQSDFNAQIDAENGLICILGDIKYPPENAISCITGKSNEVIWSKGVGNSTGIIVSLNGVYVSYVGYSPGLDKYDLNGGLVWSRTFRGTGLKYFYLYENLVQLSLVPERFLILNAETEEEIDGLKGEDIILKTQTEIFTKTIYLESKDLISEDINWSFDISNKVLLKPIFTDDYVIMRTGKGTGKVLVLDRQTGEILLETADVISNVVYVPEKNQIIVMKDRGAIFSIDLFSEQETKLVEFSNPPFFLNGQGIVGGYELAFDESLNFLYVLLGDSRQLYAFQLR